jgi:SAM-dependent methyltransferase
LSEGNGNVNGQDRKVICLGCPSSGQITDRAAAGLYRPSRRRDFDVRISCLGSSLATGNMNGLWAWALNTARKERLDYFAMIHTDIEPEEFWLDALIDELESHDLDVLGVVAPIKDQRGVTSTALARPDGDTWRVHARLTMKEVHRLPETFTSADVGHQLLINTGLWVCRFREEWARKVFFTVNDRIAVDPVSGNYFAQTEPEDWFISRLYHELGLRVGATRKVRLEHRGTMAFTNAIPWGANDHDREYVQASPLAAEPAPPGDWFPHFAAGWLSEEEGRELARLGEGKAVLEIGSYCGRSTICLAQKARNVAAVDTFNGDATALPGRTRKLFEENLARAGVADRVTVYEGTSADYLPFLPPAYDLVFIDGDHSYEAVAEDIRLARERLRPGGLLACHDYGRPDKDFGVTQAVDELLAAGGEELGRTDSLIVVRPPALELAHSS